MQRTERKPLRKVEHATVELWLSRLVPRGRQHALNILGNFLDWMGENSSKFAGYDPDMLVEYQRGAGNGELYDILDVVQRYIQGFDIRYGSMVRYYTTIKAFFAHNRAPLPDDPRFQILSDKPQVMGDLPLTELRGPVVELQRVLQGDLFVDVPGGAGPGVVRLLE